MFVSVETENFTEIAVIAGLNLFAVCRSWASLVLSKFGQVSTWLQRFWTKVSAPNVAGNRL